MESISKEFAVLTPPVSQSVTGILNLMAAAYIPGQAEPDQPNPFKSVCYPNTFYLEYQVKNTRFGKRTTKSLFPLTCNKLN